MVGYGATPPNPAVIESPNATSLVTVLEVEVEVVLVESVVVDELLVSLLVSEELESEDVVGDDTGPSSEVKPT